MHLNDENIHFKSDDCIRSHIWLGSGSNGFSIAIMQNANRKFVIWLLLYLEGTEIRENWFSNAFGIWCWSSTNVVWIFDDLLKNSLHVMQLHKIKQNRRIYSQFWGNPRLCDRERSMVSAWARLMVWFYNASEHMFLISANRIRLTLFLYQFHLIKMSSFIKAFYFAYTHSS